MKPEFRVYSDDDIMAVLRGISFPNSVVNFRWQFRCATTTFNVEKRWTDIKAPREYDFKRGRLVWCEFYQPDVDTGIPGVGRGRDEIVLAGATESAVVKTAWLLVELLIRHELMEGFCYKGVRIFDPHKTVVQLGCEA